MTDDTDDLTPADTFEIARSDENDLVIRCTTPAGRDVEFVAVHLDGPGTPLWVQHWVTDAHSLTTSDQGVRNMIDRCDPDFELIREKESHLATLREDS